MAERVKNQPAPYCGNKAISRAAAPFSFTEEKLFFFSLKLSLLDSAQRHIVSMQLYPEVMRKKKKKKGH